MFQSTSVELVILLSTKASSPSTVATGIVGDISTELDAVLRINPDAGASSPRAAIELKNIFKGCLLLSSISSPVIASVGIS